MCKCGVLSICGFTLGLNQLKQAQVTRLFQQQLQTGYISSEAKKSGQLTLCKFMLEYSRIVETCIYICLKQRFECSFQLFALNMFCLVSFLWVNILVYFIKGYEQLAKIKLEKIL